MAPRRSLSRQWRTARATVPGLPALLLLTAANLVYFAWSQHGAAAQRALVPVEISPTSIVTLTSDEGQRLQAQASAASPTRPKAASAMLLEYEDAPPKVIAPDR